MKLAIVGSRDYPQPADLIISVVSQLVPGRDTLVSGGARGVDSCAESAARGRGIKVETYRPDYDAYKDEPKAAPLARNTTIVERSEAVVAFWDFKSTGTLDTILKALRHRRPLAIFGPDGYLHSDPIEFTDKATGEVLLVDPFPRGSKNTSSFVSVDPDTGTKTCRSLSPDYILWVQLQVWCMGLKAPNPQKPSEEVFLAEPIGNAWPVSGWLENMGGPSYQSAREKINQLKKEIGEKPIADRNRGGLLA